jgi:hypothetical protein
MVAAAMYRGSLIAVLRVWIATFQQYSSRWSGVNSAHILTASPMVVSTVSLQANSNANGVALISWDKTLSPENVHPKLSSGFSPVQGWGEPPLLTFFSWDDATVSLKRTRL